VIRDVVVHMANEQPLMCDIRALPTAQDACLVCTNVRYLNGKKPPFIDNIDSWFLFPLPQLRFLEIAAAQVEQEPDGDRGMLALPSGTPVTPPHDDDLGDLETDEDLLRRIREA
jgi:hypothetical protein